MKNLLFIGVFIFSFLLQAVMTKIIGNYWFPHTPEVWIFRLLLCLGMSLLIFNNLNKKI